MKKHFRLVINSVRFLSKMEKGSLSIFQDLHGMFLCPFFCSNILFSVNFSGMRKSYGKDMDRYLEHSIAAVEPIKEFTNWFNYAENNCKLGYEEINAMALATASKYFADFC